MLIIVVVVPTIVMTFAYTAISKEVNLLLLPLLFLHSSPASVLVSFPFLFPLSPSCAFFLTMHTSPVSFLHLLPLPSSYASFPYPLSMYLSPVFFPCLLPIHSSLAFSTCLLPLPPSSASLHCLPPLPLALQVLSIPHAGYTTEQERKRSAFWSLFIF